MTSTSQLNFPELSINKVHIFYADTSALDNIDRELTDNWLDQSEQNKVEKLHFLRDKTLYQLSHYMLRWVLSQYLNMQPQQIEFDTNQYGKPSVKGCNKLFFNLSHTNGVSVIALSKNKTIGIDVEKINPKIEVNSIADNFFHPNEVKQLNQLSQNERPSAFYKIWTLKEAYIKAKGMGLSIPLRDFNFNFDSPNIVDVNFNYSLKEIPSDWKFTSYESEKYHNFIVSVAAISSQLNIEAYDIQLGIDKVTPHQQRLIAQTR
jgi:4'-phosphopantetheinyl transferase